MFASTTVHVESVVKIAPENLRAVRTGLGRFAAAPCACKTSATVMRVRRIRRERREEFIVGLITASDRESGERSAKPAPSKT
jgi:hypothetical protein